MKIDGDTDCHCRIEIIGDMIEIDGIAVAMILSGVPASLRAYFEKVLVQAEQAEELRHEMERMWDH